LLERHLNGTESTTFGATEMLVSIVVPTRNEVDNIEPLLARVAHTMQGAAVELIFVDDSDDGTPELLDRLRQSYSRDIVVVHREPGDRKGGLGGAVVEGLKVARGEWVCVMDADLQHPPEVIDSLVARARETGADLVVASRFVGDGDVGQFGAIRQFLSKGSTALARLAFSRQLRNVSDPMSGFFLVRRDHLEIDALRPHGFKILLEILVRTPDLRVAEVPFHFGERFAGESKASIAEARNYIFHLWRLRIGDGSRRFGRFAVVGLTGLVVNTLLLALLTDLAGIYYLLSVVLATQGSTLWNFVGTEKWVFQGGDHRHGWKRRMGMFFAINNAALLLRGPIVFLLTTGLGIHYLISNFLSLALLTLIRYAVSDSVIWAKRHAKADRVHSYDVHGIATVQSSVALPELERFRVDHLTQAPTIDVRIGKVSPRAERVSTIEGNTLRYDEGLGAAGFAIKVAFGRRIRIVASKLLRHSPHVLYTNVVEPILRWTMVERGYALVHGACISAAGDAFLITARTDTGKTTTILKTLDSQPACAFLSDDLTIVCPDGTVLSYPKPLTISRHTVSAVKTPLLSRKERIALVLQSRLHSKSGRQFAFFLTRTGLPVATINAIVQLLVPPPKYHVDRLVPDVLRVPRARLRGLVVIQRGTDEKREDLETNDALSILLENCDDAYGFPPYEHLERFLHSRNGSDLRAKERHIITSALGGQMSMLLESASRDWWRQIPNVMNGRLHPVPSVNGKHDEHEEVPEAAPASLGFAPIE
jgi:dolichol-phosphate mannosyltransferase